MRLDRRIVSKTNPIALKRLIKFLEPNLDPCVCSKCFPGVVDWVVRYLDGVIIVPPIPSTHKA